MKEFLRTIIQRAGQMALSYRARLDGLEVNYKNKKEMVSEADLAIERYLIEQIGQAYPGHAVLGEESGAHDGFEYCWVIDPIDGTASFLHGQPYFSVSIALEQEGEAILGGVYAPVLDEYFEAERGGGATLNGRAIGVSKEGDLGRAMLGTGFSCLRAELPENNMPLFNAIVPRIHSIRRMGSAAMDLCYVGAGRLDGFWEYHLNRYDIAAGALICAEAGGRLSDFSNGMVQWPEEVLVTNGLLHDELLVLIRKARDPHRA